MAEAILSAIPSASIVVIFRDPVERLESFFYFMKSILKIPQDMTLNEYVEVCLSLGGDELQSRENDHFRGVHDGFYLRYLQPWHERFGGKIHVLFYEDLLAEPDGTMQDLCQHLGIDPDLLPRTITRDNAKSSYRSAALQQVALHANRAWEPYFRSHPKQKKLLRRLYRMMNGGIPTTVSSSSSYAHLYEEENKHLRDFLLENHLATETPMWLAESRE